MIDHAVQDTFENNPDESHADYKASDKMDAAPTRGLAKNMTEKFFQVSSSWDEFLFIFFNRAEATSQQGLVNASNISAF